MRAVKAHPDHPKPHFTLGLIYEIEGMKHVARDELLEAVRLDPDDPENYARLGEIYGLMGQMDDLIPLWKEAARLAPFDSGGACEFGNSLCAAGKPRPSRRRNPCGGKFRPGG